jgi:hypothetical protein
LDKKGRYTKGSIYAAVMAQLEYWQALEDGVEIEEKPKKKKKKKDKKAKKVEIDPALLTDDAADLVTQQNKRK